MAFGNRFTRWIYNHSPSPLQNLIASEYSRGRSKKKYSPQFYEYLTDLKRIQGYSEDELKLIQDEKLRRIVHYAAKYVPYYKNLGIDPSTINSVNDLTRLPILDKQTIKSSPHDFRSIQYLSGAIEHFQTSGTSGKPLDIYVTLDCLQMDKAFTWLHRSWAGIQVGDRVAAFQGFPIIPVKRNKPPFWIYDSFEDRAIFSLQHMSKRNLPAYAKYLMKFQPRFMMGYPASLYIMALFVLDTGIETIRPRAVFTGSETLLPHQRETIELAFGCKVFDHYGLTEFVANIVQCEYGNYHIKEEYGVIEILNAEGKPTAPGEAGEIVATGLNNLAMPLIRYRTGDMAIPKSGSCPCGRGGALVERIMGRVEDVIVTPDGRFLSRLDFVFKGIANVEEAQLIQEDQNHIQVKIVPKVSYVNQDTRKIHNNLRERLGDEIKIDFEFVDRIPRLPSGKFRYVISKVPLNLGLGAQTGDILGFRAKEDDTRQ